MGSEMCIRDSIYDTSKIFAEVFDYGVAVAYPYEARVLYSGSLYYVSDVNGASAGLDPSVASEYTLGDTRSPLVVGDVVDVVLYHIHTRVTPRQVPQVRDDRYLAVIERYKDYQTGNRNAQLPILEDDESVVRGIIQRQTCLLYTSPSPRDRTRSRMPSSA